MPGFQGSAKKITGFVGQFACKSSIYTQQNHFSLVLICQRLMPIQHIYSMLLVLGWKFKCTCGPAFTTLHSRASSVAALRRSPAQCSRDTHCLYSLDFNMCLLVIALASDGLCSRVELCWSRNNFSLRSPSQGCLYTLHLFHIALDDQTNTGRRIELLLKARLAPGRITAAAIMKPITIIRFN